MKRWVMPASVVTAMIAIAATGYEMLPEFKFVHSGLDIPIPGNRLVTTETDGVISRTDPYVSVSIGFFSEPFPTIEGPIRTGTMHTVVLDRKSIKGWELQASLPLRSRK